MCILALDGSVLKVQKISVCNMLLNNFTLCQLLQWRCCRMEKNQSIETEVWNYGLGTFHCKSVLHVAI